MKIWFINQYASTPETGIGGRHHYLATELAKRGHQVHVIAARDHHLLSNSECGIKHQIEDLDGYRLVRLNTPRYVSARDKRRVWGWFVFAFKVWRLPALVAEAPDIVVYSSPALPAAWAAQRVARRLGARFVFEERDIWPLTLKEIGGYSAYHPLIRLFQFLQDHAYRKSERVISNLEGAGKHLVERGYGMGKFSWVPNGVSMADIEQTEPLPDAILKQIPKNDFVVGYAGTFGTANALDTILSAAGLLKNQESIHFVLVGKGDKKGEIINRIATEGLINVSVFDAVPKIQVPALLDIFDACILSWNNRPLYRYGIAANKIFDYLASGKPIVQAYSGEYDPVVKHKAGLTVAAEDPEALANAILSMKQLSADERTQMRNNGYKAVLQRYDYAIIADAFERDVMAG